MKCLFIILDGVGDRGQKTPLQKAKKPNLDRLAKLGLCGQFNSIDHGIRPGSDAAHLALFGYNPYSLYHGRGPLEAAGAGVKVGPKDVAVRCNFATENNGVIVDRRAGRDETGLDEMTKAINEHVKLSCSFAFAKILGHRAVLVLRGVGGGNVTDSDPKEAGTRIVPVRALDPDSQAAAKAINEFITRSAHVLRNHPANAKRKLQANVLLTRGAGSPYELASFQDIYGLKASCVAEGSLYRGIASVLGFTVSDSYTKVPLFLESSDFVFWHLKAPDKAGHDGDFKAKVRAIEECDKLIGKVLGMLDTRDLLVVVTGDHATPVSLKNHSGDPVPIMFSLGEVTPDKVRKFDEFSVMDGGLGWINGRNLMPMIVNMLGKAKMIGE